jgi:hypothetical protein
MSEAFARSARGARPVWFVTKESWAEQAATIAPTARAFAQDRLSFVPMVTARLLSH